MNGNGLKWVVTVVSIAVVTTIGLVGTLLKTDRDRIEATAVEARALALANATQVAVINTRLAEIQVTLRKIEDAVVDRRHE